MKLENILQQIGDQLVEEGRYLFDVATYEGFPFLARLIVHCAYNSALNKGWPGYREDPGSWDQYLPRREARVKNGILAGAGWGVGSVFYNFERLSRDEQGRVRDLVCLKKELSAEEEAELEELLEKTREEPPPVEPGDPVRNGTTERNTEQ